MPADLWELQGVIPGATRPDARIGLTPMPDSQRASSKGHRHNKTFWARILVRDKSGSRNVVAIKHLVEITTHRIFKSQRCVSRKTERLFCTSLPSTALK